MDAAAGPSSADIVSATNQLVQTLNSARISLLLMMFAAFVLFGIWALAVRILKNKAEAAEARREAAKDDRMFQALNRLAGSMESHTKDDVTSSGKLTTAIDKNTAVTERMEGAIAVLAQRASGQMTKSATIRQIRRQFLKEVCLSVQIIAERSLTENRYAERKEFISQKVRTQLQSLLVDARQDMRAAPFAFAPDLFFPVYQSDGSERFELVDSLWDVIEPQFMKPNSLKERIEETNLFIYNTITDHITRLSDQLGMPRQVGMSDEPFRSGSSETHRPMPEGGIPPRRFMTPLPHPHPPGNPPG